MKFRSVLFVVAVLLGAFFLVSVRTAFADPPSDYERYVHSDERFRIYYPDTWKIKENEGGNTLVLYESSTSEDRANCHLRTKSMESKPNLDSFFESKLDDLRSRAFNFDLKKQERINQHDLPYERIDYVRGSSPRIRDLTLVTVTHVFEYELSCSVDRSQYSTYDSTFKKITNSLFVRELSDYRKSRR